jgi:PAS domain S-box-containing protein
MSDMIKSIDSLAGFKRRLVATVILLNLLVYSLAGLSLYQSRIKYEKQAAVSTQNIASILDHYIKGEITSIDLALLAVKNEAEKQIARGGINKEDLNRFMTLQHSYLPALQGLRLTNSRGDVMYGTGGLTPGVLVNNSDRDYFIFERDNPKGDLFISKPVLGRIANKWIFNIARRVNNPDGSFAGTVYGALTTDHFITIFSGLDVGRNGAIALRDGELALVARYPEISNTIGTKAVSKEFFAHFNAGEKNATFKGRSGIDNKDRLITYRKIADFPLYVIVVLAQEEYLADFRKEARTQLGLVALITLITMVYSSMLFIRWKRKNEVDTELRENRTQLKDIIEFLPDATLAINKEKRIIIWNRAIEEITGVSASEMIGKGDYAYTIPFYGEPRPQLMDLVFENSEELASKYLNITREGNTFTAEVFCNALYNNKGAWIFVKASPLHDQSGNIIGAIEIIRDITEMKQAEEARLKLENQLLQARKMESVGRLAGGVAHDFNNMLSAIIGFGHLALAESGTAQPLHSYLTEIRKAADRSVNLTRQLLAFARKQTIAPRTLDLNETVAGMLKMLQRLIGENIELNWHPGNDLWQVKMDPSQVDQMLANLCVNSRDAISGNGKISIETGNIVIDDSYSAHHPGLVPGEYVRLTISDNGDGMDEETLANIFEPFFTTKGIGKGTGLGLATVYGAVKQNSGFINVFSESGLGTTFMIYLPKSDFEITQARAEGVAEPILLGQETILLVEDELAVLKMATKMLEQQGYTVLQANTPGKALSLASKHDGEIHLLVTDVIMPEMNGKDLAKDMLSLYPQIKGLFMSGYTADIIAHDGVLDESVHFIQKPFSTRDLSAKVREALDN